MRPAWLASPCRGPSHVRDDPVGAVWRDRLFLLFVDAVREVDVAQPQGPVRYTQPVEPTAHARSLYVTEEGVVLLTRPPTATQDVSDLQVSLWTWSHWGQRRPPLQWTTPTTAGAMVWRRWVLVFEGKATWPFELGTGEIDGDAFEAVADALGQDEDEPRHLYLWGIDRLRVLA